MVNVSEQVTGLSTLGTDLGGMLTNIAPGVGVFVLLMGVFGGITAIVYGIAKVVQKKMGSN